MTAHELHATIRHLLIEGEELYTLMIEAGEAPNLDSVGYTSQIHLDRFRALLGRPELSIEELDQLLRAARQRVRQLLGPREYVRVPPPALRPSPDFDWSDLMASIIAVRANQNPDRAEGPARAAAAS